jgi:hypothetical protein
MREKSGDVSWLLVGDGASANRKLEQSMEA